MAVTTTTGATPTNSTSAGGATAVSGLASGIDSAAIIDAMIKADRASTAVLETRKATFQTELDALRSLNTKLLSTQLDLAALNSPSLYTTRQATSSNTAVLSATSTGTAAAGTYQFAVTSVASGSQVATSSQPSSASTYGAGTIDVQLGTGGVTTLNISAANSSLSGIAQAINAAALGVNASVFNDGTGYRLMMTSVSTGTANAINVSGTGALSSLFSGMNTLQSAADAKVQIGTGSGAVTVTQSTNTFTGLLPGISLTANSLGASTITVANDGTAALAAMKQFVTGYNDLVQFMTDNASYDSATNTSGPLFSEGTVRNGVSSITQSLLTAISTGTTSLSTLTAVGISLDQGTGKFTLDESAFTTAMQTNPAAVSKLFTNSGASTDSGIQFGSVTTKTTATGPIAVVVTQAAQQAAVGNTADLDVATTIDATNRDLSINVNGHDYAVTLADGTYTQAQLAAHLQSVLDQKITPTADKVRVGLSGAGLTFTGQGYGLNATLQVASTSSANSALRLSTNKVYGQDVEGTINGVAATGAGQILSGATGSSVEGLRLVVTATAPIASATMTVTRGLAQLASQRVKQMTDSTTGSMPNLEDSLTTNINNLTKSISDADDRLATRRQRYQAQFLAMEESIQQSNSTSSYLTGQIKSWSGNSSN